MSAAAEPHAGAASSGRGWMAVGVATLLAFVVFGLVVDAFAPGPQGPAESSFATSRFGLAAWAELLGRAGHPVGRLRAALSQARVPAGSTLVVIGETRLGSGAARRLQGFLQEGGRLVLGGGWLSHVMPEVVGSPPTWSPGGPRAFAVSSPDLPGVSRVVSAGEGSFGGSSVVVSRAVGRGRLELLADPSPIENRLLAQADNAQLALDLAGPPGRPVEFAEAVHGFGQATGLAAIPGNWWIAFVGLALAGGAWALARGKRLGPPETPPPVAPPPRSAYVDAVAATLLRAGDPNRVARLAWEAAARARVPAPARERE